MTAKEVVAKMKADKCSTMSRSKSKKKHRNFTNKYTKCLGERGYKGIKKDGYFSKFYSYGVVGHCCIGVQAWFIWCGLEAFVPKNKGYIWNTNVYRKWLKTEPTIKGYGKVDWTTDPKKAKLGAVVFKGDSNKKNQTATHTCIFLKTEGDYVYTVNFNVSGKYKGKTINNGTIKKYHKSRIKGFANMPYPKEAAKPTTAVKKTVSKPKVVVKKKTNKYTVVGLKKGSHLRVRAKPSTKSKILAKLPLGAIIEVTKTEGSWAYTPKYKGWCSMHYLKKK